MTLTLLSAIHLSNNCSATCGSQTQPALPIFFVSMPAAA